MLLEYLGAALALLHSKRAFILCPSMMSFKMFSAWQFLLANRTLAQAVNPSIEDFIVVMEMYLKAKKKKRGNNLHALEIRRYFDW